MSKKLSLKTFNIYGQDTILVQCETNFIELHLKQSHI